MASKIVISFLGGFVGLAAVFLLFFLVDLIKDFLGHHKAWMSNFNRRRRKRKNSGPRVYRAKDGAGDYLATLAEEDELEETNEDEAVLDMEKLEQMQEMELDEYVSEAQEVVAVVLRSEKKVVGLCAFTNDAAVEYFIENLPPDSADDDFAVAAAAIALWSNKWVYAEEVNLLLQDEGIVRLLNRTGTRENRFLRRVQKRHSYRLHPQWTDNFLCQASLEDLWENVCQTASRLLNASNPTEMDKAWRLFELEHWHRSRTRLKDEHLKTASLAANENKTTSGRKREAKIRKKREAEFEEQILVAVDEQNEDENEKLLETAVPTATENDVGKKHKVKFGEEAMFEGQALVAINEEDEINQPLL